MHKLTSFDTFGNPQDPAIVLIHGIGLNRHIWDDYINEFSSDFYVLRYDLYGHGQSEMPPSKPNLKLYADQIHQLLTQENIKHCSLVGFSLGGMINRRFAMDHPEMTHKLVILNSPHKRSPELQKLVEERAKNSTEGAAATMDETIKRWFTPNFCADHPDKINKVIKWVLSNNANAFAQARQVLATGVTELIHPTPAISKPSLVITCENDSGSTPAMSNAIANEIPNAEVHIIQTLQHMGLVEQPNLFIEPIIKFLRQ